ncbi:MAG TPA: acyltransferase [Candidatus Acidoferrales bacterium]|nr:acyltransferase [Candidatus Acidoferrales bacterium]
MGYIDGCRALAVLAVVSYHSLTDARWALAPLSLPPGTHPDRWAVTLMSKGAHGIDLFFVISGFCLAYPMLAALRRDGAATFNVERFFSKRLVRIFPPYYAALFICVGVLVLLRLAHIPPPGGIDPATGASDVLREILMLDRGTHLADGATWTLFVEIRWYLVFPLMLALWLSSKRAFGVALVAAIIAFNFTRARSFDLGVLPAFMLGIVAADWQINGHPLRKYAPILTAITFDLALLLEPYASSPGVGAGEDYGFFIPTNTGWHLASFFFVVAAGSWAPLRSFLSLRSLGFIGLISYSIFLVHQPLIGFITEHAVPALGPFGTVVAGYAASIAAGALFWTLVERRFCTGNPLHDRLVRYLEPRIGRLLNAAGLPRNFTRGPRPVLVSAEPQLQSVEMREP